MNSLEFIEKEIEHQKIIIKVNTSLLNQFDKNDDVANNVLGGKILAAKNQLQTLHQIKTELEAWEVVKKYGVAYLKEKNYLELSLIYANCPENKNYQKIKKALEVKDAKEN